MKSIWQTEARREIQDRLSTLAPTAQAQWGKMSAPEMVCHLAESVKMTLGDLPCAPRSGALRYTPLKQLIIYVAPWPKGVPTAPELLARVPASWSTDVKDLSALLDRLVARGDAPGLPEHPAFGKLSTRAWGRLVYRHMDHHLRQFGV
jgi:uncharacterized protein DUF1569